MSDSLVEQVQKCADLQKKWGTTSCFILDANMNARFNVDFPALLAHLEHTQAVVDAAREARRQDDLSVNPPEHALVTDAAFDDWFQQRCVDHEKAYAALDAALEKVNDHEQ